MKINKKTIYSIDGLSEQEFLFFFEVIDKMQLTSESSPEAIIIAKKFKALRDDLLPEKTTHHLMCDGCDTIDDVKEVTCPLDKTMSYLCPSCLIKRQELANSLGSNE